MADKDREKEREGSPKGGAAPAAHAPGARPAPAATQPQPGGRQAADATPTVDPTVVAAVVAATAAMERQRTSTLATPDMDKTVPGGVYIVDGQVVDAHGNPRELPEERAADDEGSDKPPAES